MTTCLFFGGVEAVFSEGKWACQDKNLEATLCQALNHLSPVHRPWPERDIAQEIAERFGGRVVAADPAPPSPEGVEF